MSYSIKKGVTQPLFIKKCVFCIFLISFLALEANAQQVTEVITSFGGFWRSTTTANNPVYPNTSHNVLSFKYNTVNYSTGVDDNKLTTNSIVYTPADFRAFPVATVGGTVTNGASIYIALASQYDGVPNGYSNPLPTLRIKEVLIDGVHGLDLGTGATNIPASALINFPISSVITTSIADAMPDILVSQVASPTATGDTLYFIDNTGAVVGNKVSINWTTITKLGTYYLDLYSLPGGALCDTARINGTADKETTRDIRLIAFTLSNFGITLANASSITGFILKASGTSDPAFIAYNSGSFIIPAPVIIIQPVSQIVCPNVSNSVTFSVTATGGSLTYQWRKNNVDIPGATGSTYTIANVTSSSAGTYTVEVSNPVGSVISNPAYLNISIAVQPSPSSQIIATGANDTLSISATNATAYQWKRNGVDIPGAILSTYVINPVTTVNGGNYNVQLINAASAGCANILSNTLTVVASTILYSKAGVALNLPGSWGVATNGTGSSPVDFSRAEHTFIVKNNAATNGNLTIAGTLDLANAVTTISPNTTLDAGKIIRSGNGALGGSATSNLTVRGNSTLYFLPANSMLKNFSLYNTITTLLNPLSITGGSLPGTVTLNAATLNTGDSLTFKSDISGTARLASVPAGSFINGNVTIERHIPGARGWRLLSAPVSAAGGPTINATWQEGLTTASANPNLYPGFGVKIAGGTTANGFDQSNTNSSFIKSYNSSTNSFVPLPANPGTNIPISTYPAYLLYIRGDRSIDLMQGLNSSITPATLRAKGKVKTGDQVFSVNAGNYALIGNPYPSAIDFRTLTKNNVRNTMYIWDPKLAGNYGLGAYVTVSWNTATNSYDLTAASSPVSQFIPSGEAFFIRSTDNINPGTLTIKESDKTAEGHDQVFRSNAIAQTLRTNLYLLNPNGSESLLDGVLTTFDDINSNNIDEEDALKMMGNGESIGLVRNNNFISIERRQTMLVRDTVFLSISKMKIQSYKLEIIAENLQTTGLNGFLKDSYSNTINNTPIDMNGTTNIVFSINTDPASYASNRFSIVFALQVPLPVTIKTISAYRQQKNIVVEWTTENEINIKEYEIERSEDGSSFTKINTIPATAINGGSAGYKCIDTNPVEGNNYYRIRSVDRDGKTGYSSIVKCAMENHDRKPSIGVYPNPVTGSTVGVQMSNIPKGSYTIQLYNESGQLVAMREIQYNGVTATESFEIKDNFAAGRYELKLTGDNIKLNVPVIKRMK